MNSEKKLLMLSIDQIQPNELNDFEITEIDTLAAQIDSFGLIQALTVYGPNAEGKYKLIDGERRYTALKSLIQTDQTGRFELIPCYVIDNEQMSEWDQQLALESANLMQREGYNKTPHVFKMFETLKKMADAGAMNEKDIQKRATAIMGKTPRYTHMYHSIFNTGGELREMVENRTIPVFEGSQIAAMSEEDRKKTLDAISEGEKPKEAIKNTRGRAEQLSMSQGVTNLMEEDDWDDYDDSDFADFEEELGKVNTDIDSSGMLNSMKASSTPRDTSYVGGVSSGSSSRDHEAKRVLEWCRRMKSNENPTDEEWNAIEACKEIADRFA